MALQPRANGVGITGNQQSGLMQNQPNFNSAPSGMRPGGSPNPFGNSQSPAPAAPPSPMPSVSPQAQTSMNNTMQQAQQTTTPQIQSTPQVPKTQVTFPQGGGMPQVAPQQPTQPTQQVQQTPQQANPGYQSSLAAANNPFNLLMAQIQNQAPNYTQQAQQAAAAYANGTPASMAPSPQLNMGQLQQQANQLQQNQQNYANPYQTVGNTLMFNGAPVQGGGSQSQTNMGYTMANGLSYNNGQLLNGSVNVSGQPVMYQNGVPIQQGSDAQGYAQALAAYQAGNNPYQYNGQTWQDGSQLT